VWECPRADSAGPRHRKSPTRPPRAASYAPGPSCGRLEAGSPWLRLTVPRSEPWYKLPCCPISAHFAAGRSRVGQWPSGCAAKRPRAIGWTIAALYESGVGTELANLPCALKAAVGYGKRTLGRPASLPRHRAAARPRPYRASGRRRTGRNGRGRYLDEAKAAGGSGSARYRRDERTRKCSTAPWVRHLRCPHYKGRRAKNLGPIGEPLARDRLPMRRYGMNRRSHKQEYGMTQGQVAVVQQSFAKIVANRRSSRNHVL
jgi:hypothetical protein